MDIDFTKAHELVQEGKHAQAMQLLVTVSPNLLDENGFSELEAVLALVPENEISHSLEGCYLSLAADLRRGRVRSARQWYAQLVILRDQRREGSWERSVAVRYTCIAGILLPQTDNAQILLLLSILHNETINSKLPPVAISVTGRRPSVLRGSKDLSEWGRNYRAVVSIVRPLQDSVMTDSGIGASAAAIAELLYERGDLNAASIEVAGALSSADVEVAFTGYAQLARIAQLDGADSSRPSELLAKLKTLLEENNATSLMPAYEALCVRFDIQSGRLEPVRQWLTDNTSDGLTNAYLSNSYELMTRAKALIALGRCREAVTLLESLLLMLKEDFRPMDTAECLVDCAVACELLGSRELALDKLEDALTVLAPYQYLHIAADSGQVGFRLLGLLQRDGHRAQALSKTYLAAVTEAAMNFSMLFPALYTAQDAPGADSNAPVVPDITPVELQVLQLLGMGKSNNQIREELNVKLPTVKFHLTNLFEKLNAKNRTEAIVAAQRMKIL